MFLRNTCKCNKNWKKRKGKESYHRNQVERSRIPGGWERETISLVWVLCP